MFGLVSNCSNPLINSRNTFLRLLCTTKVPKSDNGINERDYIFFKPEVQSLLKKLTRLDVNKVFRRRAIGEQLRPPTYRFMTTALIQKVMEETLKKAEKMLQMPPVVPIKDDTPKIISEDHGLLGLDDSKHIFTDITFPSSNRFRSIVVREPDGTLREANEQERHKCNQIYFPIQERTIKHPQMFQPEYLKPLLENKDYEFVLDRACAQFEPDSIEFHKAVNATYEHINETGSFELLRSTRHYGPLCLYLTKTKQIDNLLVENLQTERLEDAAWLIQVYHLVHPDSKSVSFNYSPGKEIELVQAYVDQDSPKKSFVQAALDSVENYPRKADSG